MKRLSLFAFLLILTLFVFAQQPDFSIGVNGGPVFSKFKIEREGDWGYNVDYVTGYNTAVFFKMDFVSGIFVESELGYYQNGYNENIESKFNALNHTFEDSYIGHEFNDRYSFLNNMWFVGYAFNLTNKIDASASIGAYWGYLLDGKLATRTYYYLTAEDAENIGDPAFTSGYFEHTREKPFDKTYYNDFDFGVGGRLSVIYKICSRMSLRLSGVYRHGLSNILKPNDGWLEKYTRSFNLTAGVVVNI